MKYGTNIKLQDFLRRQITLTAAGSDTEYILDKSVPMGKAFIVQRMSIENKTGPYTSARFGVMKTSSFYPMEEVKNPNGETVYITNEEIIVTEGEEVGVEMVGVSSGDEINLIVEGFLVDRETGAE